MLQLDTTRQKKKRQKSVSGKTVFNLSLYNVEAGHNTTEAEETEKRLWIDTAS